MKKTKLSIEEQWHQDFYGLISDRISFLKNRLEVIRKESENYPKGTIRDALCRGSYQYFWRKNTKEKNGSYISSKNMKLAKNLCQKVYYERLTEKIGKELSALLYYKKNVEEGYLLKVFERLSEGKKKMVNPVIGKDKEYVEKWESVEYPSGYFPEGAKDYYTDKHERVHSKSEIIIANMLKANGIPYRYEFPLYIKGIGEKRPDFYCLNVRLRKEIVWEHLGMMEINSYAIDNITKVNGYMANGYYPGENLILTFEASSGQLDTRIVQDLIDKYLK